MQVLRRVLALVLATALTVAAVIGVVEIALASLGRPPWILSSGDWADWLRDHDWNDIVVRVGLCGVLVVGLLLLLVGLRRGRPSELALTCEEPGVTISATRRGVERLLDAAARSIQGVTSADVTVKRSTVRVDAWTHIRDAGDLSDRVTAAVQDRITGLGLSRSPRLTVRVRAQESR